jgi:hypothetical protein
MKHLKIYCLVGFAILFIALYCYGALEHSSRINLDINQGDQDAYLSYAQSLYETNYNYVGRRNRMPLYPLLQSLVYAPDLTKNEFFTRGKSFNIALSASLLPCLFWLFKRDLPLIPSINLWLITTFTVFIFRAGYFQTELLFYFLNFCGFLLMCRLLKKPSWQLSILTGVVLGISHLTKASILPGLMLFIVFFIAQIIYFLWVNLNVDAESLSSNLTQVKKGVTSRLLSLSLVILVFLGTVLPYINTSKRVFGHYFYNVNSTFYIWYDSWEEAEQGTRAHDDGKGWPEMTPELIPSPAKYLREHTASQILGRFLYGLGKLVEETSHSYGYFKYFMIYLGTSFLIFIFNVRSHLAIAQKQLVSISFSLAYFIVYLLLYAWYVPIGGGNRFILAQFIPFMFFVTSILVTQSVQYPFIHIFGIKLRWFHPSSFMVLGMILFELHSILIYRIVTMAAAS